MSCIRVKLSSICFMELTVVTNLHILPHCFDLFPAKLLCTLAAMGILGLSKLIADVAPQAIKESDIKNYFGKLVIWISIQIGCKLRLKWTPGGHHLSRSNSPGNLIY